MNKRLLPALILAAFGGMALAKLPAPDPAAKAKADETAAKAAWQSKVETYQLCRSQDKVAARFGHKGNAGAKPQALPVAAKAAASAPTAGASAPSAAASAPAALTAGTSTPTPAVASAPPPCADPGPFAYNPPDQKPLETSGAHSPAGNASGPPSVATESAAMPPAKKP